MKAVGCGLQPESDHHRRFWPLNFSRFASFFHLLLFVFMLGLRKSSCFGWPKCSQDRSAPAGDGISFSMIVSQ